MTFDPETIAAHTSPQTITMLRAATYAWGNVQATDLQLALGGADRQASAPDGITPPPDELPSPGRLEARRRALTASVHHESGGCGSVLTIVHPSWDLHQDKLPKLAWSPAVQMSPFGAVLRCGRHSAPPIGESDARLVRVDLMAVVQALAEAWHRRLGPGGDQMKPVRVTEAGTIIGT